MSTAQQSADHTLYVVGGSSSYQNQVSQALLSFYNVVPFRDPDKLLDHLEFDSPSALIVDEKQSNGSGSEFLTRFQLRHGQKNIPVVITVPSGQAALMRTTPTIRVLEKPYRRSQLLDAISGQVNKGVEAQWDEIEPVQRAALVNTLESFNNIADLIAEGQPIAYEDVTQSCEPLMQAVKNNTFQDMLKGVRGHDNYSYVHSMRVATLLSLFGAAIGIQGDDHVTLTTGGLLHDVGKMKIPHEVLNKAGKLDDDEFQQMKNHVNHGVDFLTLTNSIPKGVSIIASQHHERIDGSGYPNGVGGKDLNQLARMAAIIDVFSALTDRRVYKPPMEPEKALSIMKDMKGHLDNGLLMVFREMLLDSVPAN